ncbi:MAG: HD domain-containing protein [Bacteroidetes bacterium]|nr:HD domain-containing protein [Bacteroidota bacterium]MDA0873666.1 HD domain-containing protein [Bacteroidota bacterium]
MASIAAILEQTPFADVLRAVGLAAEQQNLQAWVVGGFVRDALLGRSTTDIDFVSVGQDSGLRLAAAVQKHLRGSEVHRYERFGTAAIRVMHPPSGQALVLEFVGARKESYSPDSRKPAVESGTMEDDQRRRDFTINALAADLRPTHFGELLDSFGGIADLNAGVIRTPMDPKRTFDDDPLRIIRAARFASQLGFDIDPVTAAGMRLGAERVKMLSGERVGEELHRILLSSQPSVGLGWLYETGALHHILPDLVALQGVEAVDGVRHKDNFFHTLKVVDNLVDSVPDRPAEETLWLRWAALLHDIGKTATKRFSEDVGWSFHGHEEKGARLVGRIFRTLRLPTDERMAYVQKLIRQHHRPVALVDEQVTDSAVRRLLFDAGDDLDDLMLLVRADITSKNPKRVRRYLRAFDHVEQRFVEVEEKDHLRNFQPPVDGAEIMETLGLGPSPAVGVIKNAIREAILEGEIPNEVEAARAYMMAVKDRLLAELSPDDLRSRG